MLKTYDQYLFSLKTTLSFWLTLKRVVLWLECYSFILLIINNITTSFDSCLPGMICICNKIFQQNVLKVK